MSVGEVIRLEHSIGAPVEVKLRDFDIEILIIGGLDGDSEELERNAREACKILREKFGINAVVDSKIIYWSHFTIADIYPYSIPVIIINGVEIGKGSVLSRDEIVRKALALIGLVEDKDYTILIGKMERNNVQEIIAQC